MVAAVTTTEMTTTDPLSTALVDLEPDSATTLRSAFATMFAQADEWCARAKSIKVTSVDQKREMKLARESRLALKEIRVNADKARKRLKEDGIRRGKAIDGIANVLKALIEPIEEHLLEQETFAERAEDARKETLRAARTDALKAYGADPTAFVNLGAMAEETWSIVIVNVRAAHEARLEEAKRVEAVKLEAERIAAERREADRVAAVKAEAERAERERLQVEENARLKKEAEEREAATKAEREKAAAERAEIEAKAQAEREAAEQEKAAAEAETRKAREETERAERALSNERAIAERARLDREARAAREKAEREAVETARLEAEEKARVAAELAPDREKLATLAVAIRSLDVPSFTGFTTERGKAAGKKIAEQLEKMAAWVDKTAVSL